MSAERGLIKNNVSAACYATEYCAGHKCSTTCLTELVRNWLGLRTVNGMLGCVTSLSEMNDNGDSFSKIADLIESPEGARLFVEA